ncbi:MAG: hypothetical protein NXH95_03200 [Pseudomonadaceae bacterium]|nr:hypothetical protein [Pseudomonadaceae bacterium]
MPVHSLRTITEGADIVLVVVGYILLFLVVGFIVVSPLYFFYRRAVLRKIMRREDPELYKELYQTTFVWSYPKIGTGYIESVTKSPEVREAARLANHIARLDSVSLSYNHLAFGIVGLALMIFLILVDA